VFFRQVGVGWRGKSFRVWKFRTMLVGASSVYARNWLRHSALLFRSCVSTGNDTGREELALGPDNPLSLMAAEFNPDKRHRDALLALARLNRPKAQWAFAGEG